MKGEGPTCYLNCDTKFHENLFSSFWVVNAYRQSGEWHKQVIQMYTNTFKSSNTRWNSTL